MHPGISYDIRVPANVLTRFPDIIINKNKSQPFFLFIFQQFRIRNKNSVLIRRGHPVQKNRMLKLKNKPPVFSKPIVIGKTPYISYKRRAFPAVSQKIEQ